MLSLALKKTNIEHIFLAKYVIQGCKKVNKWHRHSKSASSTAKVVMLTLGQTPGWVWRGLKSLHLFSMSRFQIQSYLLSFCLCHLALISLGSAAKYPLDSLASIGCVVCSGTCSARSEMSSISKTRKTGPASWLGIILMQFAVLVGSCS